jgi:hypothetical protein
VPAGSHATSGVYRLLSTGQLEPFHPDHPYRRQPCSTVSDTLAREEMRAMTLDTAGLRLSSMYCGAHGRCGWGVVYGGWGSVLVPAWLLGLRLNWVWQHGASFELAV